MFDTFFIKIYFLWAFIFVFSLITKKYFSSDFLYYLVALYWLLLISGKKYFSNYFSWLLENISFKNIFFHYQPYIIIILLILGYILFQNHPGFFTIVIAYIFLMSFSINMKNIFFIWSFYSLCFLVLYWFQSDVALYSWYFSFWVYFFIAWILYHFFQNIFEKFHQNITKWVLLGSIIFFLTSFYIKELSLYLPYLVLWMLFLVNISDLSFQYQKNFKTDFIIIWLFFLVFVPILSTYFLAEEKNITLFFWTLGFIISYIGYNLILKKALC